MTQPTEKEIQLFHAHICESLNDPKRVLILYLLREGRRSVTELAEALGVPQPTVSHHLKVLRERSLVLTEREGTTIYYSLADQRIIQALNILRTMLLELLSERVSVMEVSRREG